MSAVGDISERDDRPAYIKFEQVAVPDGKATLEKGRAMSMDVDYVLITPPYSKDEIRMKVHRWIATLDMDVKNKRIPPKWAEQWKQQYQDWKNGQETPLDGTPIKEWSAISPAQIANLVSMKIYTVEDLAAVNAEGLSRIGMGAVEMKGKAKTWLKAATDKGPLTIKLAHQDKEINSLKLTVEDLISKNKALMAQLQASQQPIYANQVQPQEISASDIMDDITPDEFEMVPPPIVDNEQKQAYNQDIDPPTVALETKSLSEQYEEKFGKPPHWKMKEETMRKKLEE